MLQLSPQKFMKIILDQLKNLCGVVHPCSHAITHLRRGVMQPCGRAAKHPRILKIRKIIVFLLPMVVFLNCSSGLKSGKLVFMSEDEEMRLGQSLEKEIAKQYSVIRNQEITLFFTGIAEEIGQKSDWSKLPYKVFVINDPDVYHFSMPGGLIYISRGIVEMVENVSQVALIIAHEIAHLAARHGTDRVSEKYGFAFAAQDVVGENPEIAQQIVSSLFADGTILDYGSEREYFADQKAIRYAWRSNYDPRGLAGFLEILAQLAIQNPAIAKMNIPSPADRLKRVRMELADTPIKASFRSDVAEFQTIKELLAKYSLKMPKLAMPLRVMLVGQTHTPSVDAVLALFPREIVLARMNRYL